MANSPLTEQDIHHAADQLFERHGRDIKNKEILDLLGSGSESTITRHMQTWRAIKAPLIEEAKANAALAKAANRLSSSIKNALRADYEQKVFIETSRNDALTKKNWDIEEKLRLAEKKLEEQQGITSATHTQLLEARSEIAALSEEIKNKIHAAETSRIISNERQTTINDLKEAVVNLKRTHNLETEKLIHQHEQELVEKNSAMKALSKENQTLESKIIEFDTHIENQALALKNKSAEIELLTHDLTKARDEYSTLKEKSLSLGNDLAEAKQTNQELSLKIMEQTLGYNSKIDLMTEKLESSKEQIASLKQDKESLNKQNIELTALLTQTTTKNTKS